jgi:D-beta-D-heptose 7-phosphate kinase/D-beta-D-heptose 1-phosphate adenosyltransferase
VISRAAPTRILVVGDVMLDEFVFGAVQRISPEAPVPVVEITGKRYAAGGAANVATNVASLGASVSLAGVTGCDEPAEQFDRIVASSQIDTSALQRDSSRPTTSKTRIVAGGQQIVRIDHESRSFLPDAVETNLIAAATAAIRDAGACVISDYGKGVVSARLVAALVAAAAKYEVPLIVDPKGHDYRKYAGVAVVTPNLKEAELAASLPIANDDDLIMAASRILSIARCSALLVTQGASGMTLFREGSKALHSAAVAHQVFDVTGAGDTVVATLALGMACGLAVEDAMLLANIAAGIVVAKPGTATVTLDEIGDFLQHVRVPAQKTAT